MSTLTRYLVVRVNGDMRVIKTRPRSRDLRKDEIAFPLTVTIPPKWATVSPYVIEINLPDMAPPAAEVNSAEPVMGERVIVVPPLPDRLEPEA